MFIYKLGLFLFPSFEDSLFQTAKSSQDVPLYYNQHFFSKHDLLYFKEGISSLSMFENVLHLEHRPKTFR